MATSLVLPLLSHSSWVLNQDPWERMAFSLMVFQNFFLVSSPWHSPFRSSDDLFEGLYTSLCGTWYPLSRHVFLCPSNPIEKVRFKLASPLVEQAFLLFVPNELGTYFALKPGLQVWISYKKSLLVFDQPPSIIPNAPWPCPLCKLLFSKLLLKSYFGHFFLHGNHLWLFKNN